MSLSTAPEWKLEVGTLHRETEAESRRERVFRISKSPVLDSHTPSRLIANSNKMPTRANGQGSDKEGNRSSPVPFPS